MLAGTAVDTLPLERAVDAPPTAGDSDLQATSPLSTDQELTTPPVETQLVEFPDDNIRDPNNFTIPASTVEANDAAGELLTGEGVGVGIISDSFNFLTTNTFADDIASGDLPADVNILRDSSEEGFRSDEGRALAQIIHDIAPNAELSFHSGTSILNESDLVGVDDSDGLDEASLEAARLGGNLGDLQIARAYDALSEPEVGNDIIIDDLNSVLAPIFQQGFRAQAQQRAFERGISVFQAAGSADGKDAIEVEFTGTAGDFVDFDPTTPGVQGIPLTYTPGTVPLVVLHWDDPYQSVSPGSDLTADFDLQFLGSDSIIDNANPENNRLTAPQLSSRQTGGSFAGSFRQQLAADGSITGADPYEGYGLPVDTEEAVSGQWHVRLRQGAGQLENGDARTVRLTFLDGPTPDFSNAGSNASTNGNINTVGSVDTNLNFVEDFNAVGRNTIIFDNEGNRIPELERKSTGTTFLAPTGINTTFFGQNDDTDPDDFPNFFGSSAAAAAAAGVGALLLDLDPALTPNELRKLLSSTADGRGSVSVSSPGLISATAAANERLAQQQDDSTPREAGQGLRARRNAGGNLVEDFQRSLGDAERANRAGRADRQSTE
jgi:hypothetical protein